MRERLLNTLQTALPGIDFEISDMMVDDGILDSLAITTIIGELSMEFGINIPFEELESRNFNSLDSMLALIERCPKNGLEF
jgi:acyl carrier protein